jgi:hypothetical protein
MGRSNRLGFGAAGAHDFGGVVAKRTDSRYQPGERGWIKIKNRNYWRYELEREREPPLKEVALAASALAELRHGRRNTGVEALKRLVRHG